MKRFGEAMVRLRIPILLLSFLLLIPSVFGIIATRINYDILYYLPTELETVQGQDILLDEFGKAAYSILICEDMRPRDAAALKQRLEQVDHVDTVLWYDDLVDLSVPVEALPESVQEVFYSRDRSATLMFLFMDTTTSADETLDAVNEIRRLVWNKCFLSSMSCLVEDLKELIEREMPWYVAIAAALTAVVLSITLDSFLVPAVILLNIGMGILYNLGSNFLKGEISFLTLALVAVLQLGVTLDYSIFLYSSYKEHKPLCATREEAMAEAVAATIVSITGSSLTTIAGFIALCFMSFTLGMDLGTVMAKGVVFSVISCVTVLPALILTTDKAIERTSHRPLHLGTGGVTDFVLRHQRLFAVLMVILWVPAFYGNSKYEVYYKLDRSIPEDTLCVVANKELEQFEMSSMSMILVSSELSHKDTVNLCKAIRQVDGVNFCMGLDSLIGPMVPVEMIPDDVRELLESEHWKLLLVSSAYELATDEVNHQCAVISSVIKHFDPNGMLIGETACTKDLIEVTDHDFAVVNAVSIGAIFVLIFLVLQSVSLPFILVLVIELAICLNMGISFYTHQTLPFIASTFVGTIQLGATVDYAILMTTRYKKERIAGRSKEEAVRIALETSIQSIITSAFGFFAATGGVGLFASADMIASICMLLSRGALISMVIVLSMLPSMLLLLDRLICKTTLGMSTVWSYES